MAPALLALGLGAQLLGALTTDAAGGGRAEVMVGVAPVTPSEPSEASVGAAVTPLGALRFSDENWHLTFRYAPRLLWRTPNAVNDGRPLLLQAGSIEHQVVLGPSVTLSSDVQASAGKVDYSMYALQATPGSAIQTPGSGAQPAQPGSSQTTPHGIAAGAPPSSVPTQVGVAPSQIPLSVIDLYDVAADSTLGVRTDPRTKLDIAAAVGDTGPIGTASNAYPHHTRASLDPSFRYELTPTDNLRTPVSIEYHRIDGVSLTAESAELQWEHHIAAHTTTILGAGALYAKTLDASANGTFFPSADAGISHALYYDRFLRVEGGLNAGLHGLLFVVDAQFRPIASLQATLDVVLPPRWQAGVRVSFSTTMKAQPYTPNDVETFFVADAPVVYKATPNVAIEFGARALFSAPNLHEQFEFENVQVWGYGGLSVLFGTGSVPTF